MRILFDQGTPAPLRHRLVGHDVATAFEMGWATLSNGELLQAAEADFDILLTTDKNLRYQQNRSGNQLAILVLPTTSWPQIERNVPCILEAIAAAQPGELTSVAFPG